MKLLRELIYQIKRMADSLMMIEMTLLKVNKLKYQDIQSYAKNYRENADSLSKHMNKEQIK